MRCAVKRLQGGPRGERSIRDRERVREAVERPPRGEPDELGPLRHGDRRDRGDGHAAERFDVHRHPRDGAPVEPQADRAETDGPVSGVVPRIAVAIREAWLSRHAVRARH